MRMTSAVAVIAAGAVAYRAWNNRLKADGSKDPYWKSDTVDDAPRQGMSANDETLDQSFPASDPPANY